jgi:hypothetical protein
MYLVAVKIDDKTEIFEFRLKSDMNKFLKNLDNRPDVEWAITEKSK